MNNYTWIYISIVSLCLFAIYKVLYIYTSVFNGKLSHKQEDFGTFGDFIGGTLNPFFGLLSFIALLITIHQQKNSFVKENQRFSDQQRMHDLFKIISKLTDRINNNYNSNSLDNNCSIHKFIIIGTNFIDLKDEDFEHQNLVMENMKNNNSRTYKIVSYITSDLINLRKFLIEYEELSQYSSSLTKFYCSEYSELVDTLIKMNWVNGDAIKFYRN